MFSAKRTWVGNSGATNEALQLLRASTEINLPKEYFELLAFSNGGEGELPISPFNFCLDSATRNPQ